MPRVPLSRMSRRAAIAYLSNAAALIVLAAHPSYGADLGPRDYLTTLQRRLTTERQAFVKMTLSMYGGMFGGAAKQPPVKVTIAWEKPNFYYVHEGDWGKNPACWYWLEGGELQAFQYWPGTQARPPRARGVRVPNFAQLAGGQRDAVFRLAKEKVGGFAYVGGCGAEFLEVLNEAAPKAMSIEKRGAAWRMRQKATDFKSSLVRDSLFEDKTAAFVIVDVVPGNQQLKTISINPDVRKLPDFATTAKFDEIAFVLDRKKLAFPKPTEVIKSVELKSPDKIRPEILDSLHIVPVTPEPTGEGDSH